MHKTLIAAKHRSYILYTQTLLFPVGDSEYDQHVHQHGRRHRSQAEYLARRTVFQANLRFIQVLFCAAAGTQLHQCKQETL